VKWSCLINKALGDFGETYAAHRLAHSGYQIVDRNLRYPAGEIDILAREGDELVFVEVKTRRAGSAHSLPEDSITDARMEHLQSAIDAYFDSGEPPAPYRIEVIAVEVDRGGRVSRFDIIKDIGFR
jgi:putative endonuclease